MISAPLTRRLAALAVGAVLVLTACGGDSDDGPNDESTVTVPAGGDTPSVEDVPSDGDDLEAGLAAVGLETKGEALVFATDAEGFEVQGDVIHLHLADNNKVPAGTECMIVSSVLSDGERAVVHRADGTEVACD